MRTRAIVTALAVLGAAACGEPAPPPDAPPLLDAGPTDATPPDSAITDSIAPDSPPDSPAAACGACTAYAPPSGAGDLAEPALVELSGLAASRARPGVLYGHNDSGDTARFFAVGDRGESLGEFALEGATAVDWEDLAVGPCGPAPGGTDCVYVADVGDNAMARAGYAIYRVAEPDVRPGAPAGTRVVAYERIAFTYPDGRHNAEAVLVDPRSAGVYVLTKVTSGASGLYRVPAPAAPGASVTAVRVADVRVPAGGSVLVTAADAHPCEPRALVRTYDALFEYRGAAGAPLETWFAGPPVEVPVAGEAQGEAAGYAADGRGYFTTSEGAAPTLYRAACE